MQNKCSLGRFSLIFTLFGAANFGVSEAAVLWDIPFRPRQCIAWYAQGRCRS